MDSDTFFNIVSHLNTDELGTVAMLAATNPQNLKHLNNLEFSTRLPESWGLPYHLTYYQLKEYINLPLTDKILGAGVVGDLRVLTYLINNDQQDHVEVALIEAVKRGDVNMVKYLSQFMSSIEDDQLFLIYQELYQNYNNIIYQLLTDAAIIKIINSDNKTLKLIMSSGDVSDLVGILNAHQKYTIRRGADKGAPNAALHGTLALYSVIADNVDNLDYLYQNEYFNHGILPVLLTYAIKHDSVKCVQYIAQKDITMNPSEVILPLVRQEKYINVMLQHTDIQDLLRILLIEYLNSQKPYISHLTHDDWVRIGKTLKPYIDGNAVVTGIPGLDQGLDH